MSISAGSYKIGPQSGKLLLKTGRTGMAAKVGHDLTLEVTSWDGDVTVDPENPSASSVTINAHTDSIEVKEGVGGVKALSDGDKAEIKKSMKKVLGTQTITFKSTSVSGSPTAFTVDGEATISGVTNPITVQGKVEDGHATGSTTVVQSQYKIKPFSAMLGQLKLKDDVGVEFDIALT